jgi:pimeloyl-ACP methyl ester carboxylesterase
VLHGADDRVLPVENGERLAAALPNAELELYEGGSHLFFIESADDVTANVRGHVTVHAGGSHAGAEAHDG